MIHAEHTENPRPGKGSRYRTRLHPIVEIVKIICLPVDLLLFLLRRSDAYIQFCRQDTGPSAGLLRRVGCGYDVVTGWHVYGIMFDVVHKGVFCGFCVVGVRILQSLADPCYSLLCRIENLEVVV